ncbi:hypothetical protein BGZ51_009875, partial [Haplosporangium sp. Z 767]
GFKRLMKSFWTRSYVQRDKNRRRRLLGLRDQLNLSWTHFMMCRDEIMHMALLQDLNYHAFEFSDATGQFTLGAVLTMLQGEMNTERKLLYGVAVRNKSVEICPVGSLAVYLFELLRITGSVHTFFSVLEQFTAAAAIILTNAKTKLPIVDIPSLQQSALQRPSLTSQPQPLVQPLAPQVQLPLQPQQPTLSQQAPPPPREDQPRSNNAEDRPQLPPSQTALPSQCQAPQPQEPPMPPPAWNDLTALAEQLAWRRDTPTVFTYKTKPRPRTFDPLWQEWFHGLDEGPSIWQMNRHHNLRKNANEAIQEIAQAEGACLPLKKEAGLLIVKDKITIAGSLNWYYQLLRRQIQEKSWYFSNVKMIWDGGIQYQIIT